MKLSAENQELLDSIYPGGYEVKEKNVYHILFIKVFQTGGRHNTIHGMVQKFSGKDWAILKKQIDNGFKLGAITGYDELAIIHDPTGVMEAEQAKELAKQEAAAKAEEELIAAEKAKEEAKRIEMEQYEKEKIEFEEAKKALEIEKKAVEAEKKKLEKTKEKPGPKPAKVES